MGAPDPSAIPEGGGVVDFSGGDEAGLPDPSNAEMEAMQEASTEDAPAEPAAPAVATGDLPKPAAAVAAPAEPEVAADPPAPGAPAAMTAEQLQAETKNLRKGWSALAREKEAVLEKVANANAIAQRAKDFEEKARQFDSLPDVIQADPLTFLFRVLGKNTAEEQEAWVNDVLLNKVIETEKSPLEREVAKMRQEREQEKADATKKAADDEVKAKKAENDKVLADWAARNIAFASSTPENVEKYDLINSLDQHEAVHATVQAYFELHKVVLDPVVAADHLEARLRAGAKKSKALKEMFKAESPPAAAAPAPAPKAQPSNGTSAPKRTGTTTLTSVASGEGAPPAAIEIPEEDDRMEAVLRQMQAAGELPDEWRVSGPSQQQ